MQVSPEHENNHPYGEGFWGYYCLAVLDSSWPEGCHVMLYKERALPEVCFAAATLLMSVASTNSHRPLAECFRPPRFLFLLR